MKRSTALIHLALYAMLILSAQFASAQPFSPADYFPLAVGNHWEYETIWNGAPNRWGFIDIVTDTIFGIPGETISYKVVYAESIFGSGDTSVYRTTYWSFDEDGNLGWTANLMEGNLLTVYDSLVLYLRNPITVGDSFHYSGSGYEGTYTVKSVTDSLDLPLDFFENCLTIHDTLTFNGQAQEAGDTKYIPISYWPEAVGIGRSAGVHWSGEFHTFDMYLTGQTPVENEIRLTPPLAFSLTQNHPNPFNPSTTISFSLPKTAWVNLRVYDVFGRSVAELVNRRYPAGVYGADFDGSNVASGVYLYQLKAGDYLSSGKMVLLK